MCTLRMGTALQKPRQLVRHAHILDVRPLRVTGPWSYGQRRSRCDEVGAHRGPEGAHGRGSVVSFGLIALGSGLGWFCLMLAASEAGWRIGHARLARHSGLAKGAGSAEAATFALFGLLVAFTFSGAASRFGDRRDLVQTEANAIGTAYLRLDLLPTDVQPVARELFRQYVDTRYEVYRRAYDRAFTDAKLAETAALAATIWESASAAVQRPGTPAATPTLLLGALNQMIDITSTRQMATQNHPPLIVFLLLGGLSLVCSVLVGYGTSQNPSRSWLHVLTFAAVVSLTVYVILDIEFPRLGLIRVDSADEVLLELRESMQ